MIISAGVPAEGDNSQRNGRTSRGSKSPVILLNFFSV
jgi:hypothetical protein